MQKKLSCALREKMSSEGLCQESLAKQLAISQPTISRALSGRWTRVTPRIHTLMVYCGLSEEKVDPASSKLLMSALAQTWDGTPHQEKVLAGLILRLGEWAHSMNENHEP